MFPPKNASRSGLASVGKLVVGAACLAALSACATVTRGPNVDFNVVTEPAGATVTTNLLTPDSKREFCPFRAGWKAGHSKLLTGAFWMRSHPLFL